MTGQIWKSGEGSRLLSAVFIMLSMHIKVCLEKTGTIIMRCIWSLQMGKQCFFGRTEKRSASSGKKTVTFPCLPVKVLWKKGKTDILTVQEIRKHTALTKKGNVWKPSPLWAAVSRLLMKRKHRFVW
ncbi:Uncharacterised protein [Tyzzerella nexilis]|uniref:Uncharacterized protein n=1 Tax=[Clostridium] nexile TaxID=29361 RepID=A0A6N2U5Y4_9FIRM